MSSVGSIAMAVAEWVWMPITDVSPKQRPSSKTTSSKGVSLTLIASFHSTRLHDVDMAGGSSLLEYPVTRPVVGPTQVPEERIELLVGKSGNTRRSCESRAVHRPDATARGIPAVDLSPCPYQASPWPPFLFLSPNKARMGPFYTGGRSPAQQRNPCFRRWERRLGYLCFILDVQLRM